jgi:hypothetical protein
MAKWVKCTDENNKTVWINVDNVTLMMRHDDRQHTEIIFVGGGRVLAVERSEEIVSSPQ